MPYPMKSGFQQADRTRRRGRRGEDTIRLGQELENLQNDYNSFNQTKRRTFRRHSYTTSFSDSNLPKTLDLMKNVSPRSLMSSIQSKGLTPNSWEEVDGWRVRNNDLAVEEVRRDRRAAMESGKLKGRRLDLEGLEWAPDEQRLIQIASAGGKEHQSVQEEEDDDDEHQLGSIFAPSASGFDENSGNEMQLLNERCLCSPSLSSPDSSSLSGTKLKPERENMGVVEKLPPIRNGKSQVLGWIQVAFMVILGMSLLSAWIILAGQGEEVVTLAPT